MKLFVLTVLLAAVWVAGLACGAYAQEKEPEEAKLPPESRKIDIPAVVPTPLKEILDHVSRELGINLTASRVLEEKKVKVMLVGVPWRKALDLIALKVGGQVVQRAPNWLAIVPILEAPEEDNTERNMRRLKEALKELRGKKKLTDEDKKLRKSLEKSLARLKDMKSNLEKMQAELRKLNGQAEDLLRKYGGLTLEKAEEAIESKDYSEAAKILAEILKADPSNVRAKELLESILSSVFPGPYSERWAKNCLTQEGGSERTEAAVKAALRWLKAHQDKNGQWDQDGFQKNCNTNQGAACDGQGTSQFDVGVTGLALLAFMGHGHTSQAGQYKETVKKGLEWLAGQQQADGSLGPRLAESWVYNHAIATCALCEAYALTRDDKLKEPAQKAVSFILRAQNPGLGWKYEPQDGRSDTSVTGWMVTALKTARNAGLQVPDAVFQGALNWLDRATNTRGKCGYMRPGDDGSVIRHINEHYAKFPTMTAVSVFCRILCGQKRRDPKVLKGVDILAANLPEWNKPANDKVGPYYWYYGTYAVFQYGGDKWKEWNKAIKKALLDKQRSGGCAAGSWDPVGKWDMVGGRVYSTAINCLTLEVYYRYAREK